VNESTPAVRLWPIWLASGFTRKNALAYLYAAFFSVCLLSFLSFIQPYLLSVHLGIPRAQQGSASGLLGVSQELVVLALIGPWGALSDKIGRRAVYMLGFVWLGAGYALFPFATNLTELVAIRVFFAVGVAAVAAMMATVLADTPAERSRGLMVGITGTLQGIGVMFAIYVLSKLPLRYAAAGFDDRMAGVLTFWTGAGLCLLTALVCWLGLRADPPTRVVDRESLPKLIRRGLAAARSNPRLALAYVASFAGRGDLVIVGTYFSLWAAHEFVEQGLTRPQAMARAGATLFVAQLAGMIWGPIFGWLMDRLDRVTALALAMALAAVGYIAIGAFGDPLSPNIYVFLVLLGVGELSAILSGQTLLGQQAPRDFRGSVMGLAGFCGALGVLGAHSVGGYLFDAWRPGGPFIMMGIVNLLVFALALLVRVRVGRAALAPAES
jgi:MFS family permease